MDRVKNLTVGQLKENAPDVTIGATAKVYVKIREGEKSRTQVFEGTIIAVNGSGIAKTFTVRKIAYGVGIERVFPVHSPNVEKVEVAEASSIISAIALVRLLNSSRNLNNKQKLMLIRHQFFVYLQRKILGHPQDFSF